jgi:hypothetical protein
MTTLLTITGLPCSTEADLILLLVGAWLLWTVAGLFRRKNVDENEDA